MNRKKSGRPKQGTQSRVRVPSFRSVTSKESESVFLTPCKPGDPLLRTYRKALEEVLSCPDIETVLTTEALAGLQPLTVIPDTLTQLIQGLNDCRSVRSLVQNRLSSSLAKKDEEIQALKQSVQSLCEQRSELSKIALSFSSTSRPLTFSATTRNLMTKRPVTASHTKTPGLPDFNSLKRCLDLAHASNMSELMAETRRVLNANAIAYYEPKGCMWVSSSNVEVPMKQSLLTQAADSKQILSVKPGDLDFDPTLLEIFGPSVKCACAVPIVGNGDVVAGVLLVASKHYSSLNRTSLVILSGVFGLAQRNVLNFTAAERSTKLLSSFTQKLRHLFTAPDYPYFSTVTESILKEVLNAARARVFFADKRVGKIYTKQSDSDVRVFQRQKGIAGNVYNNQATVNVEQVTAHSRFVKEVDDPSSARTRCVIGTVFGKCESGLADGALLAIDCKTGTFGRKDSEAIETIAVVVKQAFDYMNIRLNLHSMENTFKSLKRVVATLDSDYESRTRSLEYIQSMLDSFTKFAS